MYSKLLWCTAASTTVGVLIFNAYLKYYKKQKVEALEEEEEEVKNELKIESEVIFFPDEHLPFRHNSESGDGRSQTVRLAEHIKKTKKTLDVCVYMISNSILANAVCQAYSNGARVRVLTEGMEVNASGSQIKSFWALGIPVRYNLTGPSTLMHHKFLIIDDEYLLTGSLNWTLQGVSKNHESVLITNDPSAVDAYKTEFIKLWDMYADSTKN